MYTIHCIVYIIYEDMNIEHDLMNDTMNLHVAASTSCIPYVSKCIYLVDF